MVSIRSPRAGAGSPAARFALVAAVAILVAACAPPGAVSTATPGRQRGRHAGRTVRQRRRQRRAVGERRGGRPELRHRPGHAQRLLRDRLRPAVQAVGGVHQAVPERDLGHQAGPVHEPHDGDAAAAVRRQSRRPDPAAVDGHAGQGRAPEEPRRLRHRVRLGRSSRRRSWRRTASPRTGHADPGSLYAAGLNYSLTGVFYNKELAQQIGMTEPPTTRRRVRGPAGQGEGRRTCCRSWPGTPPPAAAGSRSRSRT